MRWFAARPQRGTTTGSASPSPAGAAAGPAEPEPTHVAVSYEDPFLAVPHLKNATAAVCARLGLSLRTVDDVDSLVDAALNVDAAHVVLFPHFDQLLLHVPDLTDPHWHGARLDPAAAQRAGVRYVIGTAGQDGNILEALQRIFGPDVVGIFADVSTTSDTARLEHQLEQALDPS
ncbi:hypothetical protein [Demequina capsici]|uniref:Uncharacterized protein n=1 Tax=Demequina capsici TaxID=3075620 RepID=A0AA96F670_9MICO|nr:hypothetical protein [Demequina sp. OYTSA14]WNM23537.1 hypothetical protein RN606_09170 [Demequina sp. OYTSA14]